MKLKFVLCLVNQNKLLGLDRIHDSCSSQIICHFLKISLHFPALKSLIIYTSV